MKVINLISILFLSCSIIDSISASNCCKEIEFEFLQYSTYDHCEGKDSANLTLINQFIRDSQCSDESARSGATNVLLSCTSNSKQTSVNQLEILARSVNPNGALINIEILYLVTSGSLQGKYVYLRKIEQDAQYLKICSSILGYGYVSSKKNTLLISDKLDLNILISPSGAFELFKKGCTTVCQGNSIVVGPTQIRKVNRN